MTARLATALYVGAIVLMAALLAALWWAPGPLAAWRHWQAPAPQAPKLDDVQAALLHANPAAAATYPVVLARPLFEATRRPSGAPSTAKGPAAAPSAIEQARLQGIVAGPTLSGVMLEEGGQSRFVRVGEAVGDWTLQSVQGRQARFVRRGQQRVLDWAVPAGEPAPAPSAKAPSSVAATAPAVDQRAPTPAPAAPGATTARPANPPPAAAPQAQAPPPAAPATTASAPAGFGSFGGGRAPTPPGQRPDPSAAKR
ncbi:MAG: hypothetical protein JSS18_07780 [Proteobacteria bacterium]|nr:hypothetical protein [Pseudomonadota bacterium]MBS0415716.1 hypothetical protein [Pseudomonadota bacterium]